MLIDFFTFAEVTVMNLDKRGKDYMSFQKSLFISGPVRRTFVSEQLPDEGYCAFSCQHTDNCFSFEYLTDSNEGITGGTCTKAIN